MNKKKISQGLPNIKTASVQIMITGDQQRHCNDLMNMKPNDQNMPENTNTQKDGRDSDILNVYTFTDFLY